MGTEDVQRSLGRIEGRLDSQDTRHEEMRATLAAQDSKLDTIVRYIERDKGTKRTLLAVGTAVATACGTAAGIAVTWITGRAGHH